jgi:hydroxyacylglutathione hydrolase
MIELLPGLRQSSIEPDGSCGAIYLIGEGKELALVDSGAASNYEVLRQELADEGIAPQDLQAVYITHGHGDHYEGAVELRKESDAIVYVGEADRLAVETGDYWKTAGFFYGRDILPLADTQPIGNGYERHIGNVILRAIETPGHTMGSITYELLLPHVNAKVALMGDTAWGGWHERLGSDLELWKKSIEELRSREYTSLSFGHCVKKLIDATPHLDQLYDEIGLYNNAYDDIPARHFIRPIRLSAA